MRDQKIGYQFETAKVDGILYYDPRCCEGIRLGVGVTQMHLRFDDNPFFKEDHFHNIYVSLSAISGRLGDWVWAGDITARIDTNHIDFEDYLTWDLTFWGRYAYCKTLGLHVGFYAITGMKVDRVYPILGFDWKPKDCLSINAVFPCHINVMYDISPNFSTGPAIRFFEERMRVSKKEELPQAIWEYRNWGIEWALQFGYKCLLANLHVGATAGGKLKVSDKHHDNAHHFKFKAAPYIGGELSLGF